MARPEKEFQTKLVGLLHTFGYKVAHFYSVETVNRRKGSDAIIGTRWMTPIGVDGRGFPDLYCMRRDTPPLFIEVKSKRGVVSPPQLEWLRTIAASGYARAWVLRDQVDDLDTVARWLARPHDPEVPTIHGVTLQRK